MARRKQKASLARRLHRSFGTGAALFVIWMVLSGIAINHSSDLGMDQRPLQQSWLFDWYGLGGPQNIYSFAAGDNWLSFAGSQLYLDGEPVSTVTNGVGAVASGQLLIAAASDELLLLDQQGSLVERLPWDQAGPVEAIGLLPQGGIVVRSMQQLWLTDADLLAWKKLEDITTRPLWSHSAPAPEDIQQVIRQHYRGENLNQERLLLDLHSGRIFGPAGVFIFDLLALAVGFLALSGLLLWLRGKRNGQRNGKRNGEIK